MHKLKVWTCYNVSLNEDQKKKLESFFKQNNIVNDDVTKEMQYLEFFHGECDFGPAHEDVVQIMNKEFTEETGEEVPDGY